MRSLKRLNKGEGRVVAARRNKVLPLICNNHCSIHHETICKTNASKLLSVKAGGRAPRTSRPGKVW